MLYLYRWNERYCFFIWEARKKIEKDKAIIHFEIKDRVEQHVKQYLKMLSLDENPKKTLLPIMADPSDHYSKLKTSVHEFLSSDFGAILFFF